jgi:hypothetical protein
VRDAKISAQRDRVSKLPDERRDRTLSKNSHWHSRLRNTCWEARPRRCVGPRRRATHPHLGRVIPYPFDTSKAAAFHFLCIRASVSHVQRRHRNATRHRIVMRTIYIYFSHSCVLARSKKKSLAASIPISCSCGSEPKIDRGVARAIAFPEDPFCESAPKIIPRCHSN